MWWRERGRGWLPSAVINAAGATATAVVALVVSVSKFETGAWMVIAVLPPMVALLYAINRHYRSIEDRLLIAVTAPVRVQPTVPRIVVPIDRASLRALSIARGLGGEVHAVHISYDPTARRRSNGVGRVLWAGRSRSIP